MTTPKKAVAGIRAKLKKSAKPERQWGLWGMLGELTKGRQTKDHFSKRESCCTPIVVTYGSLKPGK